MSFNRENVLWQSADGTWSRGFYVCHVRNYGEDEEDIDPEWDVDYDYDRFNWVSVGHTSEQAAEDSWSGGNCGSPDSAPANDAERLDDLAAKMYLESKQHFGYYGPPKYRTSLAVQDELNKAIDSARWHKIDGYSNDHTAEIAAIGAQLNDAIKRNPKGDGERGRTDRLQTGYDTRKERDRQQARFQSGYYDPATARRNTERRALMGQLAAEIVDRRAKELEWATEDRKAAAKAGSKTAQTEQGRQKDGTFDFKQHAEPNKLE